MRFIIRGVVGVSIGVLYGLLVGAVVYLLTHIGLDYEHPGPLIPNSVEFARLVTVMAALMAGALGVLVGLTVGLMGPTNTKAGAIGLITGSIVIVLMSIEFPPSLDSMREAVNFLGTLAVLPVGLGLIGILVAIVVSRLKRVGL